MQDIGIYFVDISIKINLKNFESMQKIVLNSLDSAGFLQNNGTNTLTTRTHVILFISAFYLFFSDKHLTKYLIITLQTVQNCLRRRINVVDYIKIASIYLCLLSPFLHFLSYKMGCCSTLNSLTQRNKDKKWMS